MDTRSNENRTSSGGSHGDLAISDKDYVVGIIIAIIGNMCISFSYQFQKLAHKRNVEKKPYTSLPLWWLGLSLMVGGEIGNFLAYGWAPATVVSPLGAASVIVNALLAHVFLKEQLSKRNMLGVLLAIIGAVVISLTAPKSSLHQSELEIERDGAAESSYIYRSLVTVRAFLFLVCVVAAALFLGNPCKHPKCVSDAFRSKHVWANCLMCGLLGCITVMGAKGVSTALTQLARGDYAMFTSDQCWLTYLLIASALVSIVGQVHFLNRAMMSFGASEVVPVYFVLFTLCTVSAGMVLYMEVDFGAAWRGAVFLFSIALTFVGVYLIQDKRGLEAMQRHVQLQEDPEHEHAQHSSRHLVGEQHEVHQELHQLNAHQSDASSGSTAQHAHQEEARPLSDAHDASVQHHAARSVHTSGCVRPDIRLGVSRQEERHRDTACGGDEELRAIHIDHTVIHIEAGGGGSGSSSPRSPSGPSGGSATRVGGTSTKLPGSASKKAGQLLGAAASRMRSAATPRLAAPSGYAEVSDTTAST